MSLPPFWIRLSFSSVIFLSDFLLQPFLLPLSQTDEATGLEKVKFSMPENEKKGRLKDNINQSISEVLERDTKNVKSWTVFDQGCPDANI